MSGNWDDPQVVFRHAEKGLTAKCTNDTGGSHIDGSRTLTITDQNDEEHQIYLFGSNPTRSEIERHAKQAQGWEFLSMHGEKENWYPIIEPEAE
ncbi:hypothetical protein [Vibrio owensii]|uniref:hypothetical protein n=1 Tax=Vibrio owensii TaxID=696485 RepID=UPI003CC58672